jgi:hypothetical protein
MHGRIHGGTLADIEAELFDAWHADATATGDGRRRRVLMIVATNERAALMSERARHTLVTT